MIDFYEGIIKIANVVLSVIAGYIAVSLMLVSKEKQLKSWKALVFALVFFMVQEILGALRAFNIFSTPHLTHIVPSIVLGFLIYALGLQIYVNLTEK